MLMPVAAISAAQMRAADTVPVRAPEPSTTTSVTAVQRQVADVAGVNRWFSDLGYRLDGVRDGGDQVPRIVLANLPEDMATIDSPESRKLFFITALLPIVLQANEDILQQRSFLRALRDAPVETWTADDHARIEWLAGVYLTDPADVAELLRRVDTIPPSLALAQAAEESGWGTSRFVKEGNAVFGQWTFNDQIGLVPTDRAEGKFHLVRAYGGLFESVEAYMRNLNTHEAYTAFRNRRSYMRERMGDLEAPLLAATLLHYSERRAGYVKTIRGIITANGLSALDAAQLEDMNLLGRY